MLSRKDKDKLKDDLLNLTSSRSKLYSYLEQNGPGTPNRFSDKPDFPCPPSSKSKLSNFFDRGQPEFKIPDGAWVEYAKKTIAAEIEVGLIKTPEQGFERIKKLFKEFSNDITQKVTVGNQSIDVVIENKEIELKRAGSYAESIAQDRVKMKAASGLTKLEELTDQMNALITKHEKSKDPHAKGLSDWLKMKLAQVNTDLDNGKQPSDIRRELLGCLKGAKVGSDHFISRDKHRHTKTSGDDKPLKQFSKDLDGLLSKQKEIKLSTIPAQMPSGKEIQNIVDAQKAKEPPKPVAKSTPTPTPPTPAVTVTPEPESTRPRR